MLPACAQTVSQERSGSPTLTVTPSKASGGSGGDSCGGGARGRVRGAGGRGRGG